MVIGRWVIIGAEDVMSDSVFELKDVDFSYLGKYPALCRVNMAVNQGEKVSIIGANGSGKSTLLHMLDGLIFPDSGVMKAFGRELSEDDFADEGFCRDFRRRVGLVFQNPDIQLFCPTVKDDIFFGPLQFGMSGEIIEKRFKELVGILGIGDLLDRPPHHLSLGEKRKVAIASTLIIDPDVLILDEPTAGLDPLTTRHIIDLLIRANEAGKTIITSTHDLHIVEEISDKVHVFSAGKTIVNCGAAPEILQNDQLLKNHNLLHIHAHRHHHTTHVHPHQHLGLPHP